MAKCTNTVIAREARATQIIKRLRRYYALGQKVEKYLKKHDDRHALTALANRHGMTNDFMRKARQFARVYSPSALNNLCRHRKPLPDGLPLNWAYVLQLIRLRDAEKRNRLQQQAVDEGWTAPAMGAVVREILVTSTSKKLAGKSRGGGRRFKRTGSPEALLSQLIIEAEFWNRRFEKGWTVNGHLDLDGLTRQAGKRTAGKLPDRLRRAREALTRLQEAAGQAAVDLQKLERHLKRAKR